MSVIDELNAIWPVPSLDILPPPELLALLGHHHRTCVKDHRGMDTGAPNVSAIDFKAECFICNYCDVDEPFEIRAKDAVSITDYVCSLLQQGVHFNTRHFQKCYTAAVKQ